MWRLQNVSLVQTTAQKHKDFSFIIINDTEKQQLLTFRRLNQQFFLLFLIEKTLKQLIDYQDSWRLIFFWSNNLLLD